MNSNKSLYEVNNSVDTNKRGFFRKLFSFAGPAFLVSVGYMDPGNWATDIAGGSQFGYKLLWVLLMSNLMALLLQSLCSKLGIVSGRDLAQISRDSYPRWLNYILWVLAELAIAATDLAEVLGMAIGLFLLFKIPLLIGVLITIADTFIILFLQRFGIRKLEAFILSLVILIGLCFFIQIILAKPSMMGIIEGVVPQIPNSSILIIVGIIGATVMPHNLYLHSALVQSRKIDKNESAIRSALKYNFLETFIALNLALFVNGSILILAAATFHKNGLMEITEIFEAHKMLAPLLGTSLAPILFAIALIASGQSSTVTGTLAGQVVMEGYLNMRLRPWLRRIITRLIAILPALLVIIIYGGNGVDDLLVLSQVALSVQLGFAVVPLLHATSNKNLMGTFANKKIIVFLGSLISLIVVILNMKMVYEMIIDGIASGGNIAMLCIYLFIPIAIFLLLLFLFVVLFPILYKKKNIQKSIPHRQESSLIQLEINPYQRIAIAIDFGDMDQKVINNALSQGGKDALYHLFHVVETPTAFVYDDSSNDFETIADIDNLSKYSEKLKSWGYHCTYQVGYGNPADNLIKLVGQYNCDLLVMGQHRHKGLKDIIYGQTINTVRHELKIPLLIVS